ncbi:hypothetical protein AB4K20DRAFT_1873349 [Rhizopus microsporus]
MLKRLVRHLTQNYCRFRCKQKFCKLQSERKNPLRCYWHDETLLPPITKFISYVQFLMAQIQQFKAGQPWLENNDNSSGFLVCCAINKGL